MAFSHLSMETESYQLFLSNSENEKNLENSNISSAGSFELVLDRTIDLSPLLYMKSTNAEVAISHFSLTSLPLTVTRDEEIKVQIFIPPGLATANRFYSAYYTNNKLNNQYHRLPLKDLITAEPDTLLTFLNRETLVPYIHFILRSMLQIVLDDNVFSAEDTHFLTRDDIKLLNRYINISIFSRNVIHDFLNTKLDKTNYELDNDIKYSKDCENYTLRKEENFLQKSKALRPLNDRPATRGSHDHAVDFALFHGKDLETIKTQEDGPKQAIETDYLNYLTNVNALKRVNPDDENSQLHPNTINTLTNLIRANKALIFQAMKLHDILQILTKKIDKRNRNPPVNDHLLTMSVNEATGKLKIDFETSLYLLNNRTSIKIMFPPKLSHVLGSDSSLVIGPIHSESPLIQAANEDLLTNRALTSSTFF